MNTLFDLDLLHAFVAVVDARNFTAASRHLNLTQSTVSQKILRLEETAGLRLLDRSKRTVRPTEAGEQLLGYARRMLSLNDEAVATLSRVSMNRTLRLGLPEDLASAFLTPVLADFIRSHDKVTLDVTSGLSQDLRRGYDVGEFDLVVVKQRSGGKDGVTRWPDPLGWLDSAMHPVIEADPLPLVAFPPHGLYRSDMTQALDAAGRRWNIVYTSSSLASIQSAIADGLGVGLLPLRAALPVHRVLTEAQGLPEIPPMEIAIHHRQDASALILAVAAALADAIDRGGHGGNTGS
ncbi:LysR family transcriptional regulator [Rhizobium sp. KVB221]|uniref:HTH-type transcriptional regulator TtuA n=1 Tax=Rhizobium setariae TaxID=2801340 RepID=A0A936YRL2_9HYPH|nr:LysR substrate-binding domain-containing protein [Rhizobium setariae]MBL0373301.1 LysR family transcriptional regulator [Rhizobium setariae]